MTGIRSIKLSRGLWTVVSEEDFAEASKFTWYAHDTGGRWYAARRTSRRSPGGSRFVYMHRWLAGAQCGAHVDHVDGNTLNNTRPNLRICTPRQNAWNQRGGRGTSAYRGVHWSDAANKWVSQIQHGGKTIHLGVFATEDDAARAWDKVAVEIRGEFAVPNIPEKGAAS